ncbi:helix-turn-helix domain-containing protein [Streptomyces olivoreticuli]
MSRVAEHSALASQAAPVLLTVPEAATRLRVSKWSLYQLIRSRQLETIRIGSRRFVPLTAVHALVERLRAEETF